MVLVFTFTAFNGDPSPEGKDTKVIYTQNLSQASFCSFSLEDEFGKYVKVRERSEYYSKDCPLASARFKKCESEGYAWQPPRDCELLEIFSFMEYFKNRTIIFWGDSLTEQLSGSFLCLLSDKSKWQVKGMNKFTKSMRKRRYCVLVLKDIRICFVYASDPTKHVKYILQLQNTQSVVVVNFGVHYNRENPRKNETALQKDIEGLVSKLSNFSSKIIWRETSAQHFPTVDGSFAFQSTNGHRTDLKCQHLRVQNRGWRNEITTPMVEKVTPYVLKMGSFSSSIPPSLHRGGRDCTHFCNPGVTDDWSRILMNYIFTHSV